MTANYRPRLAALVAAATLVLGGVWCTHHALAVSGLMKGDPSRYAPVYALMFGVVMWQWLLAYAERPVRVTPRKARQLLDRNVVGIVPVYNEDPAALRECVLSMFQQTRLPQTVVVVDDGSEGEKVRQLHGSIEVSDPYAEVRPVIEAAARRAKVRLLWKRQANAGKRHAQVAAMRLTPEADFYWTVDSDTVSDVNALDELMTPFADKRVMSVAGVVLAANVRKAFLTRFTDLLFVTGQLLDRSSLSRLRSVWVNSGPIAVYRAHILRDNAEGYLAETFRGQAVPYSDDSYLTLCALMAGLTVQQPTAYCFSLMPETLNNHYRQYSRWMRGSFIRSIWRMKYLKVSRLAYWLHLARWSGMVSATVMAGVVVYSLLTMNVTWEMVAWLAGVPVLIGYANCLRYLVVQRSDQSPGYQFGTFLLAPVAVFWQLTFMRAVRWLSVVQVLVSRKKLKWGTRDGVEVRLEVAAA